MSATERSERPSYAFRYFCRRPGTRINAIMTQIEDGGDLHDIAAAYRTDMRTVRVYKKALDGELSSLNAQDVKRGWSMNRTSAIFDIVPAQPEDWPWPERAIDDWMAFDRIMVKHTVRARRMSMRKVSREIGFCEKFISEICTRQKWPMRLVWLIWDRTGIDLIREGAVWPWTAEQEDEHD